LVEPVEFHLDLAEALLDVAAHRLLLVQRRLLQENAHGSPGLEESLAVTRLVEPSHDLENGGLTRTVRPHHADLGAGVERGADVVENYFLADGLAHLFHGVDELGHTSIVERSSQPSHP